MLTPSSPATATVTPDDNGGLTVSVVVPTYEGVARFVLQVERDGDGDWRVHLPDSGEFEESAGIVYLGAPDTAEGDGDGLPEVVYATSEHDRDDLEWPLPATDWFWQAGNRWVAVYAPFHEDDWWDGADEADIAARPDPWRRPIADVPPTGTLIYLDASGEHRERRGAD